MFRSRAILKLNILDIYPYLTKKRKFQLILFGFTMLASAFCEAFSLASLIPFLSILTTPNNLEKIRLFQYFNNFYKVGNANQFLLILTFIFCIAILASGILRIFNYAFHKSFKGTTFTLRSIGCESYNIKAKKLR